MPKPDNRGPQPQAKKPKPNDKPGPKDKVNWRAKLASRGFPPGKFPELYGKVDNASKVSDIGDAIIEECRKLPKAK